MVVKKMAAAGIAVALTAVCAFPAMAHGHGHHRQERAASTAAAAVQEQAAGCPVCIMDGCDETGHHLHDGVEYCGYAHESGYCDGTCACGGSCGAIAAAGASGYRSYHSHHGCYR